MKLYKKIGIAAMMGGAMLITNACTDDNGIDNVSSTETVDGYLSLHVAMPGDAGKRAVEYETGTEQENAVVNGRLLLFKDAVDEDNATLVCISELSGMSWKASQSAEVSAETNAVARLTDVNLNDDAIQYSALVVLNYDETFKFPEIGETFGGWNNKAQSCTMTMKRDGKTYMTMTSAPCLDKTVGIRTLSAIDKNQIAQSERTLTGTATHVYVQRGVAKITVTAGTFDVVSSLYKGDKVEFKGWAADIVNKTTYPTQNCNKLTASYATIWNHARFVGPENAEFRRVFWAQDPNYSQDVKDANAFATQFITISENSFGAIATPSYCLENTFDINHQMQGQTTRVVFRANYIPGSIEGYQAGTTFFKVGGSAKLYSATTLSAEIVKIANEKIGAGNYKVDLKEVNNVAGNHSLTEISITADGKDIDATAQAKIASALGMREVSQKGIVTYLNGECYYVVRVKHFGDIETPWKSGDATYGGDNDRWLGRYGMVRNNVYDITVNSVSAPGYPNIPTIGTGGTGNGTDEPNVNFETPDDVADYYIDAMVKILPWVKRVNNVIL